MTETNRLLNRRVLLFFAIELAVFGIWSQFFMRRPFASILIRPAMEISADFGRIFFACDALGCIPFVFAGIGLYFYAIAVILDNIYVWIDDQFLSG